MSQSHASVISKLEHLAFTKDLTPDQLDRISAIVSPRRWDSGATVFREGDQDSILYVVEEGHVAIEISVPGRGE